MTPQELQQLASEFSNQYDGGREGHVIYHVTDGYQAGFRKALELARDAVDANLDGYNISTRAALGGLLDVLPKQA